MAPVPMQSLASSDMDTDSLYSQATSTMTIGDSLPAQLVRKSAKRGFTFNIMLVGKPRLRKTAVISALFGKNLEIHKEVEEEKDLLNPPITIESKAFEIDEKKVRLKLNVVESRDYGLALSPKDTHLPLIEFIDRQFADFYRREFSFDRREIKDKMIHCLFFFINPIRLGLSRLDIEFLKAAHTRVNIIPIIARAENLTASERVAFKRRIKDDLEKNNIEIYREPDPEPDDPDETKRIIKEIQNAMPFAVTSMVLLKRDNSVIGINLDSGYVDPYNRDHSDFLLLKTMIHMHMADLCEVTHETFYEGYRLSKAADRPTK